jgi:hypothetical protein
MCRAWPAMGLIGGARPVALAGNAWLPPRLPTALELGVVERTGNLTFAFGPPAAGAGW